ncbi:MAG TPA: tetraacyldisaccharide 4'-kinase [Tepidisphaeraceae bacterium]
MSLEQNFLDVISGRASGVSAAALRTALRAAAPVYGAVVGVRNRKFDRTPGVRLPRPTISVGNLTTGGTGKTPVVQWIAQQLIDTGLRPAVLLRGYRQRDGVSDEAELYRAGRIVVGVNPDRVAGAASVLRDAPATDVFILDDGFQHRRVARDLDLVLIDAINPFGFGHLLPRGLLREPLSSLSRAGGIVITRCDRAVGDELLGQIRQHAPATPVVRCRHVISGLIDAEGAPIDATQLGPVTALAGIGNPGAFFQQLESEMRLTIAHRIAASDHAFYDRATLASLPTGRPVVTTEKDFTKLRHLPGIERHQILRAVLRIDFAPGDADAITQLVMGALDKCPTNARNESS